MDGLDLTHLRKSKPSLELYKRTAELEAKRRVCLKELQSTKAALDLIYQSETFNELTGMEPCPMRDVRRSCGSDLTVRAARAAVDLCAPSPQLPSPDSLVVVAYSLPAS